MNAYAFLANSARRFPAQTALAHGSEEITYREFQERTLAIGGNLLARGLIERASNPEDSREYLYRPTAELLAHLDETTEIENIDGGGKGFTVIVPKYWKLLEEHYRNVNSVND